MANEIKHFASVKPTSRGRKAFAAFAVLLSTVSVAVELSLRQFEGLLNHHVSLAWFVAYLLLAASLVTTELFIGKCDSSKALISLGIGLPICVAFVIGFAQYIGMSLFGVMLYGLGLCGLSPFINLVLLFFQWQAVRRILPDGELRNRYRVVASATFVVVATAVSLLWLYSPIWPTPGTGFGD